MVCVTGPVAPGTLNVPRTSTCDPGYTKPATPVTSLDRMEVALMPVGILTASPIPEPDTAKSRAITGSFAPKAYISGRPATCSTFENDPGSGTAAGQSIRVRSFAVSATPAGRSL